MRGPLLLAVALLGACSAEPVPQPPLLPCEQEEAEVEATPARGAWGDLYDGGTLWCGNPPQGGAPYSPFRVRMTGPEAVGDGITLELVAVEQGTGVELAYTELTMGLTCANVGENEGYWVGSEAHMRYTGFSLEELGGRQAELQIRAAAMSDPSVEAEMLVEVELVLE
jgi:hypothetical protein